MNPPGIIWLASYPKSGNTWLRFFLYNYLHGTPRNSKNIARKIPDIHVPGAIPVALDGTLFCKTHFLLTPHHPHLEQSLGFIHILRNPKDVMLSNLNYFRMNGKQGFTDKQFVDEFIANMGVSDWRSIGMGSWVEHTRSWLTGNQPFPHLALRYESMLQSPIDTFRQVVQFIDRPVDEKRLRQAVHACSFRKLKELEEKEKKKYHGNVFTGNTEATQAGYRFMSKGATGQSLAHISPDLNEAFELAFNKTLKEFDFK